MSVGDGADHEASATDVFEVQALALDVVWGAIDSLPVTAAIDVLNAGRAAYDAKEAELLAARLESGASPRSVESLLQRNDKTSKRSAKTRTRRAGAVKRNPKIARKMQKGELSPDQADVLATGAEKTDGAAAEDDDLVDRVANTPPDQARKVVDEWVREHTSREKVQDAHDRQRRLRNVRRWTTDRGTDVLALEGDTASLDRVEAAIRTRSSQLYRADGGRDLPPGQHPRTRAQRNFDAAVDLLTRTSDGGAGAEGVGDTHSAGSADTTVRANRRPPPRTTIVVTMTTDQALGLDTTPARQVGGGLLAPTVVEELFCGAELVGMLTDHGGMPLWLGRTSRLFSHAQWLALIARDGGCVHCGAHYSMCEAHHIIPWEASAEGATDIDNAVLVCTDCHHWLHDHDLVLVRDPDTGTWSTRAARPDERAPKRRPRPEHTPPTLHERPRAGAL